MNLFEHEPAGTGIDRRRVLAEIRRQLLRRGTLRLVAGFAILFALLAYLGTVEEGLGLPIEIGYYLAALLAAPVGAHRVLQDREDGTSTVLATTPLTQGEQLAARAATVLAIPALALAATLPTVYGLSAAAAPRAFATLLVHVPWVLAVATAAASGGLLVGHLFPQHPRLGLSVAFLLAIAWFVAGVNLNDIPNPGPVVAFLTKATPYTYVDSATPLTPVPAGPAAMLVGPLVLAGTALAALVPLALGLQHAGGWRWPPTDHPLALLALVGVVSAGAGGLALWEMPENPWGSRAPEQPVEGSQAGIDWKISFLQPTREDEPWRVPWGPDTPMRLRIVATGPPNATVAIDDLKLTSEKIDFQPAGPMPAEIELDQIQERDERTLGVGSATVDWRAHPRELFQTAPVELTFRADGEPVRFDVGQTALRWRVDTTWLAAGALASILPSIVVARWLPPRWNRW